MKPDQMDQFLDELKAKLPFAKSIVRKLQNGKKIVFYNRSFYSRKCTQITIVVNNYNDEVNINFIYWPRHWAKVRMTRSNNLSSPIFKDWLQSKIEEAKKHLTSLIGFSGLPIN